MRKRLRKKLHRAELHYRVVDLTQKSYWRQRLFDSKAYQVFPIDRDHLEGVPSSLANAIRARNLRFEVSKVDARDAPSWLSDGGLIIFRFRAVEFPSVVIFTGNNPRVV
jgi:hypothetical protein